VFLTVCVCVCVYVLRATSICFSELRLRCVSLFQQYLKMFLSSYTQLGVSFRLYTIKWQFQAMHNLKSESSVPVFSLHIFSHLWDLDSKLSADGETFSNSIDDGEFGLLVFFFA
jgi:hypothetical protein